MKTTTTTWLSATLDLLFHACLLALSHTGRHERSIVCTLLLCVAPIKGVLLCLWYVDTVAFGAWFIAFFAVCAGEEKKQVQKQKLRGCVPRRPYGYYGDLLLTGVNAYGFITLVNSSSITVNDSLDCSHGPYGHGAKIKMLCSDRDIAKIMRNFR